MENTQIELSKPQKLLGAILILFLLIGGAFWLTKFIPFAEIFYTLKNENSKLNKEVIKLQADFDSMKKAKEEAENEIQRCRNDPNFINQTLTNLRKELEEANQTIADLRKKCDSDCQDKLKSANEKIAELKKNCESDCKAKLNSANQNLSECQAKLKAETQSVNRLTGELNNEKRSVTRLIRERDHLTVELNKCGEVPPPPPPIKCNELKLKMDSGRATRQEQSSYWKNCNK